MLFSCFFGMWHVEIAFSAGLLHRSRVLFSQPLLPAAVRAVSSTCFGNQWPASFQSASINCWLLWGRGACSGRRPPGRGLRGACCPGRGPGGKHCSTQELWRWHNLGAGGPAACSRPCSSRAAAPPAEAAGESPLRKGQGADRRRAPQSTGGP